LARQKSSPGYRALPRIMAVVSAYASLCFPMQHSASIFIIIISVPTEKCFSTI